VPFKDLSERERDRVESQQRIVERGELYLENDKGERKATGSYYTPDQIVTHIVQHAVGPMVAEKFDAMRPRMREAEQWHRDAVRNAKAKGEDPNKYESGPAVETKWYTLINHLFDLKILDPAMGSGHFLVETVDYITDKTLAFLNSFPWNPVTAHLDSVRRTILDEMDAQEISIDQRRLTDVNLLKRHVLKRCIYGVDLNPMAVELAKVSLWLHCFTLGAPLSFLDHHMRCGNSLIGVSVAEVQDELRQGTLFGSAFAGLMLATDLMRHVGELSDVTSEQVRESRSEYTKASEALAPFKRILDVYTSQWFGNEATRKPRGKSSSVESPVVAFLKSREVDSFIRAKTPAALEKALAVMPPRARNTAEMTLTAAGPRRFFHWELEFPEVFYGPRPGTERAMERLEGAGFDAVVGNPPYDVLSIDELGASIIAQLAFFESAEVYGPALSGTKNLYKLFICRGAGLLNSLGGIGFIVPMSLLGDEQSGPVRKLLILNLQPVAIEAFPQKDNIHKRVFPEAKLATAIFVARRQVLGESFQIRTHADRFINAGSTTLSVTAAELRELDPETITLPACSQHDWELFRLINRGKIVRMLTLVRLSEGEIHPSTQRDLLSTRSQSGPLVLRGACISLYALREASQGEDLYLDVKRFLRGKSEDSKAYHHRFKRIGFQRKAPQNNFRRLIAAPIPKDEFCFESIKYIPLHESKLDLDFVLALLNSQILDWYFRLSSTNAQINEYQFNMLPVPETYPAPAAKEWPKLIERARWEELHAILVSSCVEPTGMPQGVVETLSRLSKVIQEIEGRRKIDRRAERSELATESRPIQHVIDAVLFRSYGLSIHDMGYVTARLQQML
jgi:hypothetical protein